MGKGLRYTLQLSTKDPRHIRAGEFLEEKTKKSQYIVDAILAYEGVEKNGNNSNSNFREELHKMVIEEIRSMKSSELRLPLMQNSEAKDSELRNETGTGVVHSNDAEPNEEELLSEKELDGVVDTIRMFENM
jgi:hypothetical protein